MAKKIDLNKIPSDKIEFRDEPVYLDDFLTESGLKDLFSDSEFSLKVLNGSKTQVKNNLSGRSCIIIKSAQIFNPNLVNLNYEPQVARIGATDEYLLTYDRNLVVYIISNTQKP